MEIHPTELTNHEIDTSGCERRPDNENHENHQKDEHFFGFTAFSRNLEQLKSKTL
jgi:hypothetical protein